MRLNIIIEIKKHFKRKALPISPVKVVGGVPGFTPVNFLSVSVMTTELISSPSPIYYLRRPAKGAREQLPIYLREGKRLGWPADDPGIEPILSDCESGVLTTRYTILHPHYLFLKSSCTTCFNAGLISTAHQYSDEDGRLLRERRLRRMAGQKTSECFDLESTNFKWDQSRSISFTWLGSNLKSFE